MSCNQDEDVLIDIEETEPDHIVLVDASFLGNVTVSDGQTLANVTSATKLPEESYLVTRAPP